MFLFRDIKQFHLLTFIKIVSIRKAIVYWHKNLHIIKYIHTVLCLKKKNGKTTADIVSIEEGHSNKSSSALLNPADSDRNGELKPFSCKLQKNLVSKNSIFFCLVTATMDMQLQWKAVTRSRILILNEVRLKIFHMFYVKI